MQLNLPEFNKANILVVGDVMLDKYIYGDTSRISPEAPVPVFSLVSEDIRLGGAANVALNLSNIGCNVSLMGFIGFDSESSKILKILELEKIDNRLIRLENFSTILKTRLVSKSQQLLRIDKEKKITNSESETLLYEFKKIYKNYDLILFSDYDKGALQSIQELILLCKDSSIKVIVDPKQKDFKKYSGVDLITPNLREFEMMVGHCRSEEELRLNSEKLIKDLSVNALLVTRGENGVSLFKNNGEYFSYKALALDVFDVTGAGDTLIAFTSACLAVGLSFKDSIYLANIAAGKAVNKFGTATVSVEEIKEFLQNENYDNCPIVSLSQLKIIIKKEKNAGNKIVMTNGCFDILHSGHTYYLKEAKKLGDKLIVAINSDDSVKKLKGNNRPINNLIDRSKVISSLKCVDWVIYFDELTPESLIKELSPDILVKGGDYELSEIVGSDYVLKNGGEVKTISFKEGFSSSKIIKKIKKFN